MISFRFFARSLVLMVLLSGVTWASEQKTVCTLTLNSSDEKQVFQKHLEPLGFKFVELTEINGKADHDWLSNSCKSQVRCDILVVSGHFAGKFFGSSGLSLPIEELETRSCQAACSGLTKQPKEVFLFGCNTLAGKGKDFRTPEQYLQTLLSDGLSRNQAEAAVGFRYSQLGDTFGERMRRIFPNSARIYGFSSSAPTGKHVRGLLDNYFSKAKNYYTNFDKAVTAKDNQIFLKALKSTTVVQVDGDPKTSAPICYLSSPKISNVDKLTWIDKELESGNFLKSVFGIKFALTQIRESQTLNSAEQIRLWNKIRDNSKAREIAIKTIRRPIEYLRTIQVDIVKMAKQLNWLSKEEFNHKIEEFVWGPLDTPFTIEHRDFVCTVSLQMEAPSYAPDSLYQDHYFLGSLACARPTEDRVFEKLADALQSADEEARYLIIYLFGDLAPKNEKIHIAMADILRNDPSARVRGLVALAYKYIKPKNQLAVSSLLAAVSDSDKEVRSTAIETLQAMGLLPIPNPQTETVTP